MIIKSIKQVENKKVFLTDEGHKVSEQLKSKMQNSTCHMKNQFLNMTKKQPLIIAQTLLEPGYPESLSVHEASISVIAIENGKQTRFENIDINQCDIVLNYIDRKLLARKNPDKKTSLDECTIKDVGPVRMKLFRFMLEHPGFPICPETISNVYGNTASLSGNALSKTIGVLKNCLWDFSYIICDNHWSEPLSSSGYAYHLSPKYKYLVMRYKI